MRPARFLVCAAFLIPLRATASNGINLIGFGTESAGLAGADLAVARDALAINTNPAGLAQIENGRVDFYTAAGFTRMEMQDELNAGNRYDTVVPLGSAGYAWRGSNLPLTFAVAVFAQGGSGADHEDVNTVFGTVDDLKGTFAVAKLGGGVAYQATDSLALGASLTAAVATLDQEFYPNTSVFDAANPSASFFGSKLSDLRGYGMGMKLGAQYRLSDRLKLGMAYTSSIDLDLEDGELVSNQSAIGLGQVTYRDAALTGLKLPQEIGVGAAYQATPKLLVLIELNWIDWSNAFKETKLKASEPDNPAAQPFEAAATLNWKDQWVAIVAAAYAWNEKTTLRAGYNYGRSPIPEETLTPFIPAFAEQHVTFGVEHRFAAHWFIEAALEYDVRRTEQIRNPNFPLGSQAQLTGEAIAVHATVSRRW
jgi:long-chain fatty acid transport protein